MLTPRLGFPVEHDRGTEPPGSQGPRVDPDSDLEARREVLAEERWWNSRLKMWLQGIAGTEGMGRKELAFGE